MIGNAKNGSISPETNEERSLLKDLVKGGCDIVLGRDGTLLATAEVRFAGSRAYTRRLVEPFLATTPLDDLARWFPSTRDLARDKGSAS